MSSTTDFIAELFRAANQIETLTSFERVRLTERAAATIQAQRDLLAHREAWAFILLRSAVTSKVTGTTLYPDVSGWVSAVDPLSPRERKDLP